MFNRLARATADIIHSCGHPGVVRARNKKEAESYAERIAGTTLCPECERQDVQRRRHEEGEAAQADARAAGLPPIEGRSDAAILWAERLRAAELRRHEAYERLFDAAPRFESDGDHGALQQALKALEPDLTPSQRMEILGQLKEALRAAGSVARLRVYGDLLRAKTDASWWIDRRDLSVQRRVSNLVNEIDDAVTAAAAAGADATTAAALDGAVLKPTGEPASAIIVETTAQARRIELRYPVKDAAFNTLVKDMGFRWAGAGAWTRDLPTEIGPLEERLAETAQRLLAAGFLVRVASPDARRRAQSGDFTPEHRRWFQLVATGPFAGQLAPVWERDQDFYAAVMELPGARYRTGGPYVPVGAIEAVAEFAEQHGFRLSPAAAEALRAHRAALEAGAVVTSLRAPPEPLPAPPPLAKTPPVLDTPTDVAIASELLDDEAL